MNLIQVMKSSGAAIKLCEKITLEAQSRCDQITLENQYIWKPFKSKNNQIWPALVD